MIKRLSQLLLTITITANIIAQRAPTQPIFIVKNQFADTSIAADSPLPVPYQQLAQHPCCQKTIRHSCRVAQAELTRLGAQLITLHTSDHQTIPAWHLKRGSDTLIVAACGFPAHKEQMIADVAFFANYDVLLLDYRWATPGYCSALQTLRHPVNRIVLDCIADVRAALDYAHNAGYAHIIGHGICFSAGLFVLTQQQALRTNAPHFEKLILDSCWLSLNAFADNVIKDPYLLWYWGKGGTPLLLKIVMRIFYLPLYGLCYVCLPSINIARALSAIDDTPLLFIHGAHDPLISMDKFKQVWQHAKNEHATALITPYGHSNNLSKNPAMYAYCCNQFISPSIQFCSKAKSLGVHGWVDSVLPVHPE